MRGLRQFTITEFRLFLREPVFIIFGVVFPPALLAIFGFLPFMKQADPELGGQRLLDIYVPPLVAVVIAMLGLTALTSYLAAYREKGILKRLATTPTRPATVLLAQIMVSMTLIVVAVALLVLLGVGVLDVPAPGAPLAFVLAFVLSASAMFAVSLFIASAAPSGKAGAGIGSMLFFPVVFFAGLWTPGPLMPDVLRVIGDFTPLGAGARAMQGAWSGAWPTALQLVVLIAYTVGGIVAAAKLFRWE
jgi:ABC-2 type transport system permease protein